MSAKKPKTRTKSTAKKSPKTTTKTRVSRTKKKQKQKVPPEIEKPIVDTEIIEPKTLEPEPAEITKPITEVPPEVKPSTEIQPEPVEIKEPITEVEQVKHEPELAETAPVPSTPTVVEAEPQPAIAETKKTISEVKPEVKSVKPEIKKTVPIKRLPKPLPRKKLPEPPKDSVLLIIRLRGTFAVPNYIELTLRSLKLGNKFNATLTRNSPSTRGMLQQVKDYVTWGDLKQADLATLLRERGEVNGGKPVTDRFAMDAFSKESIDSLAAALTTGEISLRSLWTKGVKPVFRLRPPSGGFKSTVKKSFTSMGELGYRGDAIATLMSNMS